MNNRKPLIASLAVLALLAGPASAGFEKGIKAGLSIANTTGKIPTSAGNVSPDAVTGLTAGVFASVGLGPVAIAPEILFTAKGFKYGDTIGSTALTVVNDFNYIDVPILVKYSIIPAGPIRPYIAVGPQISFLMSAKAKSDLAGSTTTTDIKKSLASSDYSAVVDAGLAIGLGVITLSADLRYAIGLADVSKDAAASAIKNINNKNNVISILAGIAF